VDDPTAAERALGDQGRQRVRRPAPAPATVAFAELPAAASTA